MKEEYEVGSLSKIILEASKLKKKSTPGKELSKLEKLFAPSAVKKKEPISKTQDAAAAAEVQSDKQLKKSSKKTEAVKAEPKEELSQTGYDPPPGIVHESLMNQNRSDENDEKRSERKPRHKNRRDRTKDSRTIFVGNLPIAFDKKRLKKLFLPFGAIESLRFRCAPPADLKLPKRAIAITKTFHKDRHNIVSYICYKEEESAQKALKLNGKEVDGFHIRVDISNNAKKHNKDSTVFVGNLTYDITEDDLWDHFQDCGEIENVRVIRDSKTGMGKGFGYIQFKEKDSVQIGLKLHESSLNGRKVRVMRCDAKTALKKKEKMLNGANSNKGQDKSNIGRDKSKMGHDKSTEKHARSDKKKISFRSTNKKSNPFQKPSHDKKKSRKVMGNKKQSRSGKSFTDKGKNKQRRKNNK